MATKKPYEWELMKPKVLGTPPPLVCKTCGADLSEQEHCTFMPGLVALDDRLPIEFYCPSPGCCPHHETVCVEVQAFNERARAVLAKRDVKP